MSRERASDPTEVVAPVEIVELQDLTTKDGEPVAVECTRVDELLYLEHLGLPGASMSIEELKSKLGGASLSSLGQIRAALPPIVEAGTAFVAKDGRRIAPAFSWNPGKCPPAVPGHYLSTVDLSTLAAVILRLSRFASGAAEAATFPIRQREAGGESAGTVPVREGVRDDAVAGASGS
jgi:hypothetical protein